MFMRHCDSRVPVALAAGVFGLTCVAVLALTWYSNSSKSNPKPDKGKQRARDEPILEVPMEEEPISDEEDDENDRTPTQRSYLTPQIHPASPEFQFASSSSSSSFLREENPQRKPEFQIIDSPIPYTHPLEEEEPLKQSRYSLHATPPTVGLERKDVSHERIWEREEIVHLLTDILFR